MFEIFLQVTSVGLIINDHQEPKFHLSPDHKSQLDITFTCDHPEKWRPEHATYDEIFISNSPRSSSALGCCFSADCCCPSCRLDSGSSFSCPSAHLGLAGTLTQHSSGLARCVEFPALWGPARRFAVLLSRPLCARIEKDHFDAF